MRSTFAQQVKRVVAAFARVHAVYPAVYSGQLPFLGSDIRRHLRHASPSEVFAAMSDPARAARWWGPAGFTSTIHTFDFVPDHARIAEFVAVANQQNLERQAAEVHSGQRAG